MPSANKSPRLVLDQVALIYGFAIKQGMATPYESGDEVGPDTQYLWCHVNLASESGQHWIRNAVGLPDQLVSSLCDRNEEHGVYSYGNGLMLVLEDRLKNFNGDPLDLGPLHVWVDQKRIITARWHPLAAPDRLRFRLQVGTAPHTPVGLAIELLDEIITDLETISRKAVAAIDDLEDRILDNDTFGMAAELGASRRQIIRLRRQVLPLRQVISRSMTQLPAWATAEENTRIDALLGRIEKSGNEIVEAQEQARILQDENCARAAERTNNSMYVLTLFTVIFLPLNLITGFFGMNVQGIPGVNQDGGFEWVTIGMILTLIITVLIFRYKRWF